MISQSDIFTVPVIVSPIFLSPCFSVYYFQLSYLAPAGVIGLRPDLLICPHAYIVSSALNKTGDRFADGSVSCLPDGSLCYRRFSRFYRGNICRYYGLSDQPCDL